jgi:hypothetical protein
MEKANVKWYNEAMRILDSMRETADAVVQRARDVREDLREVVDLIRHRTHEQATLAATRENPDFDSINRETVGLGGGIMVQQVDEETIRINGEILPYASLIYGQLDKSIAQHDVNQDFLAMGWSCYLGKGEGKLFVAAYQGRDNTDEAGSRILVVKKKNGVNWETVQIRRLTKV